MELKDFIVSILEHIDFELESIKEGRKAIRKKLSLVEKSIKANEDLGVETSKLEDMQLGLSEQLSVSTENLRKLKLIRYRQDSSLKILEGEEIEEEV